MIKFERICDGIYRLKVPFENIYTGVFALIEDDKCILLDSGNGEKDVSQFILPALSEAGFEPTMIVCSHLHGDHCGGMAALLSAFPNTSAALVSKSKDYAPAKTHRLTDGDLLLNRFRVLNLKGHTDDSLALLDERTSTLLSCDCLQLYGVGRYGEFTESCGEYLKTLKRVHGLKIDRIVAAHEYVPCGSVAEGKDEIEAYLSTCEDAVFEIQRFIKENPETSPAQLSELYNKTHPDLPPIGATMVSSVINI